MRANRARPCALAIAPERPKRGPGAGQPFAQGARVIRALALFALLVPAIATAQTVDQVVAANSGGCTTAGVEGLSNQLVRSHLCAFPGSVEEFAPYPNISLNGSRVHPLATAETARALRAAADRTPLSVTSAFRTLVEQYLLYHEGGCGLAAQPGNSNHQTGRAVDLSNYSAALSAMTNAGCAHPYPTNDPVHFDCPGPDMRAASTLVFQRLWNANHPEDPIAEDGDYGPQTASRLGSSPATGFGTDLCAPPMPVASWGAEYVMQTFPLAAADPIVLAPGQEIYGVIELRNTGNQTWDGNTRLGTTQPRDRSSALAGPDWLGPNRPAAVEGTVPPGGTFAFAFTLRAPSTPGEYRELFGVVQEGVTWFSDPGQLGPADDLLQVRVLVTDAPPVVVDAGTIAEDAGVEADADVIAPDAGPIGEDPPGTLVGGCAVSNTSSGTGALWLLALALYFLRRRTRATTT